MMCNPYETGGNLDFTPVRGQGIIARQGAVPGGWNDLCPNGNACRDLLGLRDPNTQCVSVTLPGKPGQTTGPVRVGLNTRFDMYDSPFKPNQEGADPQFAPAKNVTRGMANVSNACNPGTSNSTFPLPDDNCLGAGGSCVASGIGDGSWGRHTYWAKNHAGVSEPAGYGTMTRYDVYLWELANPPGVSTADETSGPRCSSQGNATMRPNEDRRVLLAPIVNCNSDSSLQNIIGFGRFFMLEPVDVHTRDGQSQSLNGDTAKWASTGNTDIRLEVIDKVNANAPNGILNEYPVLYR
jgi:hypothetical protein